MKAIYTSLIDGTFHAAALTGQIALAVSILLITAMMGRFFCGFLCSFGTMGDFFWFIGTKLKLRRPKIGSRADRILKKTKYLLLIGILLLGWTFGVSMLSGTGNPWTVFGMLTRWDGWTDVTVLLSVGMGLLLLIVAGSLYIERFFCRYLCPLGAVFAIVFKYRLFKIRKPRRDCGSCRACTKRCSMGIPLYRSNVVRSAECIDCMNCVEICPRDNVSANPKPALAAAIAVASLAGMYYAGNIAGTVSAERQIAAVSASVSAIESANAGPYTDGTYTGSAAGYCGATRLQVSVAGGYITGIQILSTGDDLEFFNQARAVVIPAILRAQSVDVDTVSGATFSSFGIIDAVVGALSGALGASPDVAVVETDDSALTQAPLLTPSPTPAATAAPTPSATPEETNGGPISASDGTYSGTGTGFRGETEVSVTVQNGSITAISIERYKDDKRYFTRAEDKIIDRVITNQSVDVDTVSGATYSSNGILEAVANALGLEFTPAPTQGRRR
ncbi:MAG: FMN-binding protein [Christensenella sp.]|nr:FMN-binding protein [Christensenella sp.]